MCWKMRPDCRCSISSNLEEMPTARVPARPRERQRGALAGARGAAVGKHLRRLPFVVAERKSQRRRRRRCPDCSAAANDDRLVLVASGNHQSVAGRSGTAAARPKHSIARIQRVIFEAPACAQRRGPTGDRRRRRQLRSSGRRHAGARGDPIGRRGDRRPAGRRFQMGARPASASSSANDSRMPSASTPRSGTVARSALIPNTISPA